MTHKNLHGILICLNIFLLGCTGTPSPLVKVSFLNLKQTCNDLKPKLSYLRDNPKFKYSESEKALWFGKKHTTPKGVALVLHGLNLKPSKMQSLVDSLLDLDIEVLRGSLSGHRGSLNEQKSISYNHWKADAHIHYCLALVRAEELKVPLYVLGYSLGALTILDFLAQYKNQKVKKMIFIAPAFAVKWFGDIPGKLWWINSTYGVPSRSHPEYRIEESTSLAAYRAMTMARDSFKRNNISHLNIPTLVFIDPKDELVSLSKINHTIKKNSLSNWKVIKLSNNESKLKPKFHHLIIDPDSLGETQWKFFKTNINSFLGK